MPEMVDPTHTPAPGQGCQLRPGWPCPVPASAALDKGVLGAEMGELAGRGVRLPVGDSVLKPCAPRRWCRVGSGGVGGEQGQPEPRPPSEDFVTRRQDGERWKFCCHNAALELHAT